MLTSAQVAALMQQQQSMFMGMQQYSQVISAQIPQAYGIGQYGMQGPMAPQFAQVPYAPRQHPGFSYGGNTFGYGLGNQMGAAGMAAAGGAAQFGLGAAGIAGGLGLLGRAGMAFDPIGAGIGIAGRVGGGLGVGLGMLGGGLIAGGMALGSHAIGSMVTGAQEQAAVNQSLGQFNFANSMSRSGRGFTRQDAMSIGSMVRELQAIPEMMTSMSELTRIMDRMGQSGMMQGARDAGEFTRRFKETISVLKDVSKMMGSTMEEAMQAFQESKQAGFYSPAAIKQNIMQRQIVGGLTGMNQQQVAGMQAFGSQLSFQMGGSRAGGARSITRIAGELGMANQMGLLSNERLMELTGEEGAAGIQQLAGSMAEAGQRMGRSSLGTAMTLALGEVKDGRYTGNMDQDLVQRVRQGQIGKDELLRIAHQKSAGRNAKLSFAAHRQRLTTEMVNQAGAQGIAMELSTILGDRGFDNPDALNLVMQRYGIGEREANQVIQLMKDMPGISRGIEEAGTTEARRMAEQAFMRENASFEGIKRKIGKKVENVLTEPFKKMGASIANTIGESVDTFVDELFGRYQTKVTAQASEIIASAAAGSREAKSKISGVGSTARAFGGIGDDLRASPFMSAMSVFTGDRSRGDLQASILSGMGQGYLGKMAGGEVEIGRMRGLGGNVLTSGGGEFTFTSNAARSRAIRELTSGANPYADQIRGLVSGNEAFGAGIRSLLASPDIVGADNDARKYELIRERLMDAGGVDVLKTLRSQQGLGGASDIQLIQGIMAGTGTAGYRGAFTGKGLAAMLGGGPGGAKELATSIKQQLKDVSSKFGDDSAAAYSALEAGGGMAKILQAAFGTDKALAREVEDALNTEEAPSPALLKKLGMTAKEFSALQEQGSSLVRSGKAGKVTSAELSTLSNTQLAQAIRANTKRERELGGALGSNLADYATDVAALQKSKTGAGVISGMQALAKSLSAGEGWGDVGSLVSSLEDTRGAERTKLMSIASPELRAGANEVGMVRQAYRKSKGSLGDLIKRLGITDDTILGKVREIAGDDKVSASEEKEIEKYLGGLRAQTLAQAKGGEQGVAGAATSLAKTLETMNKNAENTAQLLKNLFEKGKGGT